MTPEQRYAYQQGRTAYTEHFGNRLPSRQEFTQFARELVLAMQDVSITWQIYFLGGIHENARAAHRHELYIAK